MTGVFMWFTLLLVRGLLLFVNEKEYDAKIAAIPSMDQKHAGFNLQGWEYRSLPAKNGDYRHRYYYFPSSKPNAPVFLMIHGLNLDGRTYMHVTKLAAQWQLVAYDLPERCPLYTGKYDDWRAVLDDFVNQYPDTFAGVAGVSFGGGLATHLAANNPKIKATRLVLLSTTLINASEDQQRQSHKTAEWIGTLPDYKLYYLMEKLIHHNERRLDAEAVNGRTVRTILGMKNPAYYREVVASLDGFNGSVDAAKVKCPTLMIIGDQDNLYTADQKDVMRSILPQIEYEVMPKATHSMVYLYGEAIADSIVAFSKRHDEAPPAK